MDLFNLQAKIGLDTKNFVSGVKEAGNEFSTLGTKIKSAADTIVKVGAAAFTTVAASATAATAAIVKGVDAYTSFGDNIDKMSQKMGLSAQAYQEWSAIMEHSGTSIDSMQASMKTLANAVENGNDAFERLGISQEELASMNNEQLFSRTISALQNVKNETERTYLAGQLLGRGATELGALLNTTAEETEKMRQRVHELGGVMSDEAVKASAKYKDSIQDMKTAFKGLGRGLIADFVPAMTEISDGLTAIFTGDENGSELFMQGFDKALANLGNSTAKLKPIMQKVGEIAVKTVPQVMGSVGKALIKSAPELLTATSSMMKELFSNFINLDLGVFDWIKDDALRVVEAVKSTFKNIDFNAVKESFGNIGTAIGNIFEKVGDGAAWLTENAIGPLVEWVANSHVLDGIAAGFELIGDAVDFLKTPALAVWEGFLKPLCEAAGGALDLAAKGLRAVADSLKGIDWEGYWIDMFDGHFGEDWKIGWQAIYDAFAEGGQAIDDFFNVGGYGEAWNKFWQMIGQSVFDAKTSICESIDAIQKKVDWFSSMNAKLFGLDKEAKEWNVGDTIIDEKGREIIVFDKNGNFTPGYEAYMRMQSEEQAKAWSNFDIDEYRRQNNFKGYAEGGRVTKPTLAWVGEKEPETIIPDSKLNSIGNTTNIEKVEIVVNGAGKNGSEIAEEIARALADLSIKQQRAVGGVGWR